MSEESTPRPRILVTGASRGIGRAIAIELGEAGYEIAVHYRSGADAATHTLENLEAAGGSGRLVQFDQADRDATREALETDIKAHGAYYGVVLNAGIARDNIFPAMTGEEWDSVMETNLSGFYNVLSPLVLAMIRRRRPGRIVTLSSVSGLVGNRGQVNYSAAKAGIIGATKALALELAGRKITVNCVAPGLIETDMTDELPLDKMLEHIHVGRIGQPREVAGLVRFLMSDDAAYITRQVISVNGGMI